MRQGAAIVKYEEDSVGTQAGKDWSESEVRLIVADYFDMLETELLDKPYNKSEHRKALVAQLSGRSEGSIEFKHQNLSSVLIEMGLPYIEGYKPRSNYQSILAIEVAAYLRQHPDFVQRMASAPLVNPTQPVIPEDSHFANVIEDPPETLVSSKNSQKPWLSRTARKTDFAEIDAANRRLGQLGEKFVFDLEKYRLNRAGRDDLAQKVIWASRDIGDGLGFDIISFDETDDSERMVEVKATGLGKFFPFYVTSNEVCCSEDLSHQYHLYRVFDFARNPRVFILHGSLKELCSLQPALYRAVV